MERAVADQARALSSLGWRVTVVAPFAASEVAPPEISTLSIAWPVAPGRFRRPGFGFLYWLWTRRVRRAIRERIPHGATVYAHGGASGTFRGIAGTLPLWLVANPHGMEEFNRSRPLRTLATALSRYLARGARFADRVIATDAALIEEVQRNLGVARGAVELVPNAVDVSRLDALAVEGGPHARKADLISVGRLAPNKGYDLLVEALRIINERTGKQLSWVHFGAGHQKEDILRRVAVAPRVDLEIVEGADDATIQASIGASGRFVQPSRFEGSSLTTLEAMSRAAICVGTPVGGIPEKITSGSTGFLAERVSAEAIAEAILQSLGADRSVGLRARERVLSTYDLPAVVARLSDVLTMRANAHSRGVVQVARHIGPGAGVAQVVHAIDDSLRRRGVATSRLTLASTGLSMRTQVSGSPIKKLALMAEVVWFSVIGTVRVVRLRAKRPDLGVIVHGDPIGGDVYVNHGLLKEVVVVRRQTNRFYVPLNPMHWFTLVRDEVRYRWGWQNMIVCLTQQDEATLRRLYPKVRTPIRVIPNGVDLARYSIAEQLRAETRAELGIDDGVTALLFVGHEYERKGLFLLLEAMQLLDPSYELIIVGGAPEMIASARQLAERLGVGERTHFVGSQPDPRPYYGASDVVVLPSSYETGPLVLLEALASGRMVVMTPTGLATELIRSGINGEIVKRDPAQIAAGIVACSHALSEGFEDAAKRCADSVADYGWDAIADRYLMVLAEGVEYRSHSQTARSQRAVAARRGLGSAPTVGSHGLGSPGPRLICCRWCVLHPPWPGCQDWDPARRGRPAFPTTHPFRLRDRRDGCRDHRTW
ncbi:glycosyltransferase family 4 protein [Microbacterium schleiferi]|uniref:Glycosyltransferase family 4 protein n=1 Tax=Microbacterium schleiferi TaxID=69362 RepID=A0A7S8RHT3_9MICO|nr:glycosyltransferase family 4 protein [Microbacterium schleiferi]QPE05002.1 glycosyltransferase family 4 protein [Microbacterium schleiferi]